MQHVSDLVAPVCQGPHMDDLGFFPLEHLEELLHCQKLAVGARDRDHGHGAARPIPDRV